MHNATAMIGPFILSRDGRLWPCDVAQHVSHLFHVRRIKHGPFQLHRPKNSAVRVQHPASSFHACRLNLPQF